jgi:uncharacterized membrane protein
MSRWLGVMLGAAVAGLGVSLAVWANRAEWLPEDVPTHWGFSNEPDAWVKRDAAFWPLMIVPLMMFGFVGLAALLPWLSPRNFSVEPFRATYGYVMAVMGLMFLYLHLVIVGAQMGLLNDLPRWLVGGILIGMALLGNVLGKVRRNFWMGVRTPWTLANDQVWTKTHRLAAWLFVGGSVLGLVLLAVGLHPLIALAPFVLAALVPVFYSLWLYKRLEHEGRLGEGETPPTQGA